MFVHMYIVWKGVGHECSEFIFCTICIYYIYSIHIYINGAVLHIWLQFANCKYRYYYIITAADI